MLKRAGRKIPNAISIARLASAPVLLVAILLRRIEIFTWLLFACLLSDIFDGLIARVFCLTSKLGAALDSTADVATMLLAMAGVLVFQHAFVSSHLHEILLVIALYCAEIVASLVRYGRLSSFHTLLSRVAAYAGGLFVMALFFWGYKGWFFHFAVSVFVLSLIEGFVLIGLLPAWQCDVGGLHRVLVARRAKP